MTKVKGLTGVLLRVNLTEGTIVKENTPEELFASYLGGRGTGAAMLLKEVPAHTDPLGPENKLIFLTSPVVGTMVSGANKTNVTFKSPLSDTYSFSLCGGHLAPEIKFAGYDGIIIEGRSENPVYLWIDNDKVTLKDASHLWGKLTHDTQSAVRQELRDVQIRVACIGPAGEKLSRFACIQADYHREFGRGGAGAVMGSKNLKAIAVRGTGSLEVADPAALAELTTKVYKALADSPKCKMRREYGTTEMTAGTNAKGYWGTRNFQTGYFEGYESLTGETMKRDYYTLHASCYGCPVACGKVGKVRTGAWAGTLIEGPEFESAGLLGANCGVADLGAVVKATEICDLFGLDTMSAGAVVSFAMECFEKGILTTEDTGGLELRFGNGEALVKLLEMMGRREGIGDLLAEGSKRAAEKLGALDLAMQVKGMEFPTYEPRGCKGMGLTYAISPKGAHHMIAPTMGAEAAGDGSARFEFKGKGALVREVQAQMALVDSLCICATMRNGMNMEMELALFKATTGIDYSLEEGYLVGERIANLERLYNVREGFARKDDTLPTRMLQEKMPTGPSAGQLVELAPMLDEFYELMGWDTNGIPTEQRLAELGLDKLWLEVE